jgi:hypothetical protein
LDIDEKWKCGLRARILVSACSKVAERFNFALRAASSKSPRILTLAARFGAVREIDRAIAGPLLCDFVIICGSLMRIKRAHVY